MVMKRTILTNKQQAALQAYSELITRMNYAAGLGIQYNGARDIYAALGYKNELTFSDYYAKYDRQDIAASIIDKPVDTTWRGDVIVEEATDQETELEKGWKKVYEELKLKSIFLRADKLAAIGRYSVMVMGFSDATSLDQLQQPVLKGKNMKLLYVLPFSEQQAIISTSETNPSSPRFGKPLTYSVQINEQQSALIHYTRIIHITGPILDSEIYGIPAMKKCYNRLDDLMKIVGGSAEMFWRGARPGYQGKVNEGFTMGPNAQAALKDQFDEYESNLRRFLTVEGVDISALESQVSDPLNHVDIQLQMISAATNIPKRILLGSERGELASSQDQNNWYSYIDVRRSESAEPRIVRPFIDRCIELGVLPATQKKEEPYDIKWSDLHSESDKDKAEVGRIRATALKEYTSNPTAESIIPPEIFFQYFLGLDDNTIKIVMDAMENEMKQESPVTTEEEQIIQEEETQPTEEEPINE